MFWDKYVELCNSVGKAPSVVAEEIGIKSTGTVPGWKKGAVPRQGALVKLAEYFGVSVGYLLGYEQKEKLDSGIRIERSAKEEIFKNLELIAKTGTDKDLLEVQAKITSILMQREN